MDVQEEKEKTGTYVKVVNLLNVKMFNGRAGLNDNHFYLNNCSTVTAIKNREN